MLYKNITFYSPYFGLGSFFPQICQKVLHVTISTCQSLFRKIKEVIFKKLHEGFTHTLIPILNVWIVQNTSSKFLLQINVTIVHCVSQIDMLTPTGNYTVHVEGRSQGMVLFHNVSRLTCDTRFLSLVIQTSKPIYRAGQEGKGENLPSKNLVGLAVHTIKLYRSVAELYSE